MKKSNNSSRDGTDKWLDIIQEHLWLFPLWNIPTTAVSDPVWWNHLQRRQQAEKEKKSLLSLCHRVTHANQNTRRKHTRRGRQRDNWGIVGSRHVTGCVYKCVSQTLFLDEHINSRPSLPRHRLASNSHLWRSHLSFLKPYTKLKTVYSFSFHQNASPNALPTPCWQSKSSWQQIRNLPVPVYLYLLTKPMSSPLTALQILMHN